MRCVMGELRVSIDRRSRSSLLLQNTGSNELNIKIVPSRMQIHRSKRHSRLSNEGRIENHTVMYITSLLVIQSIIMCCRRDKIISKFNHESVILIVVHTISLGRHLNDTIMIITFCSFVLLYVCCKAVVDLVVCVTVNNNGSCSCNPWLCMTVHFDKLCTNLIIIHLC